MASAHEDDELDDILEDALANFDIPSPPRGDAEASSLPKSVEVLENKPAATRAYSEAVEDGAKMEAENTTSTNGDMSEEEARAAVRAFEEALQAVAPETSEGSASASASRDGAPVDDADLALVEEFIKSFGSHFADLMAVPPSGDASNGGRRDGASSSTSAGSSGNNGNGNGVAHMEKFFEEIMGQLLSPNVLRGPMETMRVSFAKWMKENEMKLTVKDRARYQRQQIIVDEICKEYQKGDELKKQRVTELLMEMEQLGLPPSEVMSELCPEGEGEGVDLAETVHDDGTFPELMKAAEGCRMQ